jgi:hypothetical protein
MAKQINDLVAFVIDLENLVNERDEWANAFALYSLKRDVLRKFGKPGEDLQKAIQELDDTAIEAQSLLEGVTEELSSIIGTGNPEEARRLLIKLKSLLNAYAEKTGTEFMLSSRVEDKTAEEVVAFAFEVIKNG